MEAAGKSTNQVCNTPVTSTTPDMPTMANGSGGSSTQVESQPSHHQPKWIFDTMLGQWTQVYMSDSVYYQQSHPSVFPKNPFITPEYWNMQNVAPQYYGQSHFFLYPEANPAFMHPIHQPPPPPPPPPLPPSAKTKQTGDERVTETLKLSSIKSKPKKKLKLPLNWKCARNNKGRLYFFNRITKHSQWHFPKSAVKTAKHVKPKKPEPVQPDISTNEPDPLSEDYKKYKDLLRENISKLIVKLLQPYMKIDCKVGRITNTDDFKHLARKFTHTILEKELLRHTNPDDVNDANKRVIIKTKEYLKKYMMKFKGEYSRKIDDNQKPVANSSA